MTQQLKKLAIRGIRSFDPETEETIEFYNPLTMIVGANGCGKTTIIESLKYICTGNMPPGVGKGHSFVNDPAITDQHVIKANIKLRLEDNAGLPTVVTRSFQVTKKPTKTEFKALDGTVKFVDPATDTTRSLTSKCSELDKQVPEMLKVSPAILDNVIFCHQEESCWPLTEGAVLKKKFDDIFESTRYTKALEAVRKAKLDYSGKSKDLKVELTEKSVNRQHAQELQLEVNRRERAFEEIEREVNGYAEQMATNDENIQSLRNKIAELERHHLHERELLRDATECEKRIADKEASIASLLDGETVEMLKNEKENFLERMVHKRQEQSSKQKEMDRTNHEIVQLREEIDKQNLELGKAMSLRGTFADMEKTYNDFVEELPERHPSTQAAVTAASGLNTSNALSEQLMSVMQDDIATSNKAIGEAAVAASEQEQDTEPKKIAATKLELLLGTLEQERTALLAQRSNVEDTRDTHFGLGKAKNVEKALKDAEENAREADEKMKAFMADAAATELRLNEELIDLKEAKALEQQALDADRVLLEHKRRTKDEDDALEESKLEAETAAKAFDEARDVFLTSPGLVAAKNHAQVLAPENPIFAHLSQFATLDASSSSLDAMKRYLDSYVTFVSDKLAETKESHKSSFRRCSKFDAEVQSLERQVRQLGDQLDVQRGDKTTLAHMKTYKQLVAVANRTNLVDEAYISIIELDANDKCKDDANGNPLTLKLPEQPPSDLFKGCVDLLTTLHSLRTEVKLRRWLRTDIADNSTSGCVVCEQREGEPAKLVETIRNNLTSVLLQKSSLHSLGELEYAVTEAEKLLTAVYKTPGSDMVRKFAEELKNAREQLQEAEEGKTGEDAAYAQLGTQIEELESAVQSGRSTLSALDKLNDLDITARKKKMAFESKAGFVGLSGMSQVHRDPRTVEELERDESTRIERLRDIEDQCDQRRKELSDLKDKRFQQQELKQRAQNSFMQKKQENEKLASLKADLERVNAQLDTLQQRLPETRNMLETARKVKESAMKDLEEKKHQADLISKKQNDKIQAWKSDWNIFNDLHQRLKRMEREAAVLNPDVIRGEMEQKQAAIQKCDSVLRTLRPQMQALAADLNSESTTLRNIDDNLALRALREELTSIRAKLGKEKAARDASAAEYGSLADAERELNRVLQIKANNAKQHATCEGRKQELESAIKETRDQLGSRRFKDIHEQTRRAEIDYQLHLTTVSDLERYYHALDASLLRFHAARIGEVNKIIKELWETTYRGEDIDSIEIVSGEEGSTTKASRSYNYRVVMSKNDSPLDMRGRCSAGQRVLASIVIRLALAETFCLDSGILTLDEPTTNLDDKNKTALAAALAKIISLRSINQVNFQLVCITHDEDFVRVMKQELSAQSGIDMPDYYFRVFRKEKDHTGKYFSKIERIPWADM